MISIENANPEDAPLIADAILNAVGDEIVDHLAGERDKKIVHELFERLARRSDTQYSYRNTRIAKNENGDSMGVCISYDGEDLKRLRVPFFKEANRMLGWNISDKEIDSIPEETDQSEYYLDTLMTLPAFRGNGIGRSLISDAQRKARHARKPLGLLCDIENHSARKLYDSLGFIKKDQKPFAGHLMDHLLLVSHSL